MKLGTLFQFVTGQLMENSHRALGDVRALYSVFRHELFWGGRKGVLKQALADGTVLVALPAQDSDDSGSDTDGDSVNAHEDRAMVEQNEDEAIQEGSEWPEAPSGDYWEEGDLVPTEIPMEHFTAAFTATSRSGVLRSGIQVSPAMANSPLQSWRLVFTTGILEKITRHTNTQHLMRGETHTRPDLARPIHEEKHY